MVAISRARGGVARVPVVPGGVDLVAHVVIVDEYDACHSVSINPKPRDVPSPFSHNLDLPRLDGPDAQQRAPDPSNVFMVHVI